MTLTEISYYSRKLLPFAIIGILVLLIFFYAIKVFFLYLDVQKPTVTLTDKALGNIASPQIKSLTPSGTLNFTLDNVEGKPITATDSAKVYFIPPAVSRFGFTDKIYLMAKTLGIDTDNTKYKLASTEAKFTEDTQSLSIDITNFNFTYEYDVKKDSSIFSNALLPPQNTIEQTATDFLRKVDRYPEELAKGKVHTYYSVYNPLSNKLMPTDAKNKDANVVEVDFFRPDIDTFSVVSPKFPNSHNYVIMVFNDTGPKIIKAQVKFFEKSDAQVGVYPIKTGDQAFKELQEGKSSLISLPTGSNIIIKKMSMAYYDPDVYDQYLQPVYVFIGDDGNENDGSFVGYVPAVQN